MATIQNNFNGGTDGAGAAGQLTVANSGGVNGDAFASSSLAPATAAWQFSATGARAGLGARITLSVSTVWNAWHAFTATPQLAGRVVFTFNGSVTNSLVVCGVINSSFATVARFTVDGTGKGIVQDAAGTTLATTAAALAAGTAYTVEYQVAPGTTTSNGTIQVQLYTVAAPGVLLLNFSSAAANAGTANLIRGQLGNADPVTTLDLTFDDVHYETGTLTPVGPVATAGTAGPALMSGMTSRVATVPMIAGQPGAAHSR